MNVSNGPLPEVIPFIILESFGNNKIPILLTIDNRK